MIKMSFKEYLKDFGAIVLISLIIYVLVTLYLNNGNISKEISNFLKNTTINISIKTSHSSPSTTSSNTFSSNTIKTSQTNTTINETALLKAKYQKEANETCIGSSNYNNCVFHFFINLAINQKNASLCLLMENFSNKNITIINKDYCISAYINQFNINTKNNPICNLFINESDKQSCLNGTI